MRLNFSYHRVAILYLAVLLLLQANMFLGWGSIGRLVSMLMTAMAPFVICAIFGNMHIPRRQLLLAVSIFIVYLWMYAPIRAYDSISPNVSYPFILLLLLLSRKENINQIRDVIAYFIAISSVFALAVFVLELIGISLPYIVVEQDFRRNIADYYRLYGPTIVLSSQSWSVGSGEFIRTSGFLQEPGHFGMLCAAVLTANQFLFVKTRYKLTMLGGLLTFSPPFYMFAIGATLITYFNNRKARSSRVYIALMAPFALLFIVLMPTELKDRVLDSNLETYGSGGVMAVLDDRSNAMFLASYNRLSFQERLIGMGSWVTYNSAEFSGATSSDFRRLIATKGSLSLVSLFLVVLIFALLTRSIKIAGIVLLLFVIIALHRASMLQSLWLPILLVTSLLLDPKGDVLESDMVSARKLNGNGLGHQNKGFA